MAWVKIDDQFSVNAKVLAAGKDGRELHISALCHCNRNLTDGLVAVDVVRQIGALFEVYDTDAAIERLLAIGLWERVDGGYMIHDYLEYNPSREQVLAQRAEARERMRAARAKNGRFATTPRSENVRANTERISDSPNTAPIPIPSPIQQQQPAPEQRQPIENPDEAALFAALEDAGQMLNATDAQLWTELLAEHGVQRLIACIREARNVGARPSPKYVGTMAARTRADGVQPGVWAGNGKSRASPKPHKPLPPLTPGIPQVEA